MVQQQQQLHHKLAASSTVAASVSSTSQVRFKEIIENELSVSICVNIVNTDCERVCFIGQRLMSEIELRAGDVSDCKSRAFVHYASIYLSLDITATIGKIFCM